LARGRDLVGIGGRDQDLRDHAVGLQRDRREQRVELGLLVDFLRMRRRGREEQGCEKRKEELHAANVRSAPGAMCPIV